MASALNFGQRSGKSITKLLGSGGIADSQFAIVVKTETDKRQEAVKQAIPNIEYTNHKSKPSARSEDGQIERDGMDKGREINLNRGLDDTKEGRLT